MAIQLRKRAFSKAFQNSLGHADVDVNRVVERAAALFPEPTAPPPLLPVDFLSINKENGDPETIGVSLDAATYPVLQADFPDFTFDSDFGMDTTVHSTPSKLPKTVSRSGNGGGDPIPLSENRRWSQSSAETDVQDHQFFDSAPGSSTTNLSSSPPRGSVLASCLEPDFSILQDSVELKETVIYMPDPSGLTDVFTPSALNFQDLTLFETSMWPQSAPPLNRWPESDRTSYFTLPSVHWKALFPNILPSEVIISFAHGQQVIKIDRYTLCAASSFFAQLLNTPYEPSTTQCLRLRDDFPWAIAALVEYLTTGTYTFHAPMLNTYPSMTLADLHVHAYLAGRKYAVPLLCEHATRAYIDCAENILLQTGVFTNETNTNINYGYAPTYPQPLLDSLLLLWRNTPASSPYSSSPYPYPRDTLRSAALDCIVKPQLNTWLKVPFFATMMREVGGFAQDLCASLEEDGLKVGVVGLPVGVGDGVGRRWGVRFGGAE